MSTCAIKVNAGHNVHGNPRRGRVVIDCHTGETSFVEEGWIGRIMLEREAPDAIEANVELPVSPGTYRKLKSGGKALRR